MIACAAEVSWYSSSSTTRNASRIALETCGTSVAKSGSNCHLIGELNNSEPAFQVLVMTHQTGQFQPLLAGDDRLLDVGIDVAPVVARSRRQAQQQPPRVAVKIADVHQVLLQISVEPEHPVGHRGRPEPRDELERSRRSAVRLARQADSG